MFAVMKIVGDELAAWALAQTEDDKKDLFGRSAFNRYYYAAFLSTRQMLGDFKTTWKTTPHRKIPDLLKNKLKQTLKLAIGKGILSEGKRRQVINLHNTSVNNLANLLEEAYTARCIADYEPEVRIQQKNNVISLKCHKLTSAKNWPGRAASYCKAIRKAWEVAGLA